MRTRALDPAIDWQFFDPSDHPSDRDLQAIRPLTRPSAARVWGEIISANSEERHPMLLGPGHWLKPRPIPGVDWQAAWSKPRTERDDVVGTLNTIVQWAPTELVLLLIARERSIAAPWVVFRRNWRCFTFEDEAPFLVNPQRPELFVFSPGGQLGVCRRPGL